MVRIRMQRFGRTHRPFYRINAIDQRTRRNGRVLENLGHFDPMEKDQEKQIVLKEDRVKDWLSRGALPSDTVRDMLGNRDMLSDKMKAEWEADRAVNRKRGECKKALKEAESIVAAIEAAAGDSEADLTAFVNAAKKSTNIVRNAVSSADDAAAGAALKDVQKAKADADAAKPVPEPEPEPEAEASEGGEEEKAAE